MILKSIPNPAAQVLACGVLKALNLIEVIVVEAAEEWFERACDIRKVNDPACCVVDSAFDVDGNAV